MRVLIGLTYFQPHKSGLTIYAVRQSQALVALGHQVTVVTSQFDKDLPQDEMINGVHVHRVPVAFRLSKGVIMPSLLFRAWQYICNADVINLHLPQVDAAVLSILAKILRKPIVLTYHCDLQMPEGLINRMAGWAAHLANHISASLSDVIVQNSRDYAENSLFLKKYLKKVRVIKPPIALEEVTKEEIEAFKEKYTLLDGQKIIGMVARLATEKGVEYLVNAIPEVIKIDPTVRVIYVGEYQNVIGEELYKERIMPMIKRLDDRWTFLGTLSETEKSIFFNICDVLVLPSINNTESFGMVQIEAMTCGTPVVATDLPGVRQPVKTTGMGKIIPTKDSQALALAILEILNKKQMEDQNIPAQLKADYSPKMVASAYEDIFREVVGKNG